MRFSFSIDIDKPRTMVVRYFQNPQYLAEWQDGFDKNELVSWTEGQDGAISKMYYKMGKREMVLTETITANRLPETFETHYHHKFMDNTMKCTFAEVSENQTKFTGEFEYTRISWFLPRLIAILLPSMYKKQGEKWFGNFKEFLERQP